MRAIRGSLLYKALHKFFPLPADGAFARNDVAFAVIKAEIVLNFTDALTRQAVDAQIACVAHTLGFTRPLVHHTPGKLVTGLELAGIRPIT